MTQLQLQTHTILFAMRRKLLEVLFSKNLFARANRGERERKYMSMVKFKTDEQSFAKFPSKWVCFLQSSHEKNSKINASHHHHPHPMARFQNVPLHSTLQVVLCGAHSIRFRAATILKFDVQPASPPKCFLTACWSFFFFRWETTTNPKKKSHVLKCVWKK